MLDEFKKDIESNERQSNNSERAGKFKLVNGDNRIVILTNPIGFSQVYGVGMVYEGCAYGSHASRKYKCYVLDMNDDQVKITDFSYTVAKQLLALADGARTKFEGFPMPYVVNMKTTKASTKEVETNVLADDDYTPTDEVTTQLNSFSPIQDVIDALKKWQQKEVEENPEMQEKVADYIAKKAKADADYSAKKNKDKYKSDRNIPNGDDVIEYPEDDGEPIPF